MTRGGTDRRATSCSRMPTLAAGFESCSRNADARSWV